MKRRRLEHQRSSLAAGGGDELAAAGTILLDEVGEMPPALQVKLLPVLERGRRSRRRAAERLGIGERAPYRKLKAHQLG